MQGLVRLTNNQLDLLLNIMLAVGSTSVLEVLRSTVISIEVMDLLLQYLKPIDSVGKHTQMARTMATHTSSLMSYLQVTDNKGKRAQQHAQQHGLVRL